MITYEKLETIILSFPGASLSFPFDNKTPVFKVSKKMFALVAIMNTPLSINLKCDPEDALILRSQFEAIRPGYHMNKDHWNTVVLDDTIEEQFLIGLIGDSYDLVAKSLPKKEQRKLGLA